MATRRAIRAKAKEKQFYYMPTQDYLTMMSGELNLSEEVINAATKFLHVLGEVLYYNNENGLDVIFLNVSYLINAFKCVVRHDHRDATIYNEDPEIPMSNQSFVFAKSQLMEHGRLSMGLLERLWAPIPPHGIGLRKTNEPQRFWNLVQLLENFEIAAIRTREPKKPFYPIDMLVPEFEPVSLPNQLWSIGVSGGMLQVERYFDFAAKTIPPRGIMQRFQVKVCPLADPNDFNVAKDGLIASVRGCDVFAKFVEGKLRPAVHGFQLIFRGKEDIWKTVNTLVAMFNDLIEQWPGIACDRYAVVYDDGTPNFLPVHTLEFERDKRKLSISDAHKVTIVDVLGDPDAGVWL